MEKIKFWSLAIGFILFMWFLVPDNTDNQAPTSIQQPTDMTSVTLFGQAPGELSTISNYATNNAVSYNKPANFDKTERIYIRTSKGVLPLIVAIADNDFLRQQGLMHYRKWPSKIHGVLFLFDLETKLNMWMKNTYLPLDMLFINQNGIITYIVKKAKPLSENIITPPYVAKAVLEIPAGSADKWQITIGNTVLYNAFGTMQQ